MTIANEVRERAFALYCADVSTEEIARSLGIRSSSTVKKWITRYGWVEKRETLRKIIYTKSRLSTTERHKKLLNIVQTLWEEKATKQKDTVLKETSNKDMMEAIKHERLVEGDPTEIISQPIDEEKKKLDEAYDRTRKEFESKTDYSRDAGKKKDSKESA